MPVDPLISEASNFHEVALARASAPLRAAEVQPEPVAAAAAPETAATVATPKPAPETPEPSPNPAPEPTPAAVASIQLTRLQMRGAALAAGWPEAEIDELLSVAWCESRFRIDANGWGALGLMQIMPEWFESLGLDVSWAFDPVTNLRVAYHIHQNDMRNAYGEWASWTCKPAGLPENVP